MNEQYEERLEYLRQQADLDERQVQVGASCCECDNTLCSLHEAPGHPRMCQDCSDRFENEQEDVDPDMPEEVYAT